MTAVTHRSKLSFAWTVLCGAAVVLAELWLRSARARGARTCRETSGCSARRACARGECSGSERSRRIPKLDAVLLDEGHDAAREREMLVAFRSALAGDPTAEHLALTCGRSFCRLQIDRLPGTGMAWQQIDAAIRPEIAGELIIQTDAQGHHGYVYFLYPSPSCRSDSTRHESSKERAMRKKVSFVLTLAALMLGGLSAAAATYHTSTVGVALGGEYYSEVLCKGYHDPQNSYRMNGLIGGQSPFSPYPFLWIGGECRTVLGRMGAGNSSTHIPAPLAALRARSSTAQPRIQPPGRNRCDVLQLQHRERTRLLPGSSRLQLRRHVQRHALLQNRRGMGLLRRQPSLQPTNSALDYYGLVCGPATR